MAFSNLDNISTSLTHDSDEVNEMHCEHCDIHEHKFEPATGFCVDCAMYMCDTCLKYHRRYEPNHSVQDKDRMPQDFCFEKCFIHKNQIIKFFCEDCQNFPCSECKTTSHKNCGNISHLPTLVQGIENSTELKGLTEDLDTLSQEIEQTEDQVNNNLQKVVTQETQILAATTRLREQLLKTYKKHQQDTIDNFDKKLQETIAKLKEERRQLVEKEAANQKDFVKKLRDDETSVTKKIANIRSSDQKELQSIKDKSVKMKNYLKSLSSDLIQQQNASQRCKLFMTMTKMLPETKKIKQFSDQLKKSNDVHIYIVEDQVKVLDVLSLQNAKTYFSYRELPSSKHKRAVNHNADITIKAVEDSSLCLLHGSTLLIADYKDEALMLIRNVNVCTECKMIKLASGPFAITNIEDHKVAVTFPDEGIVRLITISESKSVISSDAISVGASCYGIAYSNNHLIVSYLGDPGKVQILGMSGNVLKCFDKDCHGKPLFSQPYYLTFSPDDTTIFVSDWDRNAVTSMTVDGKVKAIYRDDQLRGPLQVTVDESGTVYVCGYASDNVHQLSSDLAKMKILLDEKQGMDCPASVTYCQGSNRLYVGMYGSNIIKVFNVSVE